MRLKTWTKCALACSIVLTAAPTAQAEGAPQPLLGARSAPIITIQGLRFRDLNRSGVLDVYEDWRVSSEVRAADLTRRMTLPEKAGVMMHGSIPLTGGQFGVAAPADGQPTYDLKASEVFIVKGVGSMISRLSAGPALLAEQNNKLQELAEAQRLGVPLLISTDPRHHFQEVLGASVGAGGFSQWPETLGFGALRNPETTRQFGDVARREYRAVGIHQALSPQADLATEPRWSRTTGTFGEDPVLVSDQVKAYIQGFQGSPDGTTRDGVLTVVKHWVGYGAARDGFDGHNYYGRYADLSPQALEMHVRAFRGAFEAKAAGVMPTYPILANAVIDGKKIEQTGAGFSKVLLTDILRGREKFDGVIISDWSITNDCPELCMNGAPTGTRPVIGTPWGVESLPRADRFVLGVNAGLDQFGGVVEPELIVDAVRAGRLSEGRIDQSVQRVLKQKFDLGLFENPYVDAAAAERIVGQAKFKAQAAAAQRQALVLLENKNGVLPLAGGKKVYLHGVSSEAASARGLTVVKTPQEADVAIMRVNAPFQRLHPNHFFGSRQNEGDLDFKEGSADYELIKSVSAKAPTILTVYLDRPAILTNVRDKVAGLIGNFGVSDEALLDVVLGKDSPRGRLPFELPSSMAAVRAQRTDLPHDSVDPLYEIGFGLLYGGENRAASADPLRSGPRSGGGR